MRFATPSIAFMRYHRGLLYGSLVLTVLLAAVFFVRPLNYSIDYTGGFLVEVQLQIKDGDPETLKRKIEDSGVKVANIHGKSGGRFLCVDFLNQQNT